MGVIDEIKDRLDIVQVVERRIKLQKKGRNYRALCPFHEEKTPSFTVFPDSGRWKCFGCGRGGDLLDFVQAFDQVDLETALQELAREAGIRLERSAEQVQAAQAKRDREAVFGAAAAYFEGRMRDRPEGRAYCESRGWTEETIAEAGLGYWDGDWLGYRKALTEAGVDLNSPPAQAVLKISEGMLVYPHIHGGRVHYLSARSIEGKRHYNPVQELVGPKHPYFNHAYRRGERVVVVEGQADAVTLGQWNLPAVALAGSVVGTGPGQRLMEILAQHRSVVIALDQDDAGERGTLELAEALLAAGLPAVRIQVAVWPVKDANDWLLQGATAEEAGELVEDAPCWMDWVLDLFDAAGSRTEERAAMERAARAYATLDAVDQVLWRQEVCNRLGINSTGLRQLVEATGGEDEAGGVQATEYVLRQGMICRVNHGERGEYFLPLCNFRAGIVEDVVEDDGEEQIRRFVVEGELAAGGFLHQVEVEAEEFGRMGWVLSQWGARAAVAAGTMAKDHLRVAILRMSEPAVRYEYGHLGFRKLNGRHVYLSAAGAVGMDGVQVRLPRDLDCYRLPVQVDRARLPAAIEASLAFMETGSLSITVPVWAAMYLAPLSTLLPPSFTLWLFGTTGSLKSTVTALAMCHFGQFAYNNPPASWTGTANALEKKAFVTKDAPLWIDDYTAQSTMQGMSDIKRKADQLLRDWGNRAGRSRMQSDLSLRRTFVPRGLIISTAEQLPPGQSILSRLFSVEVHPEMMTRGEGSALTRAQIDQQQLYTVAMAGYVSRLAERWDELEDDLRARHLRYVELARRDGEHLRMPGNVATMYIGYEMGLEFARDEGVIDDADLAARREMGWQVLLGIGEQQHQVVAEEKPVEMYVSALEQMFAQGSVYLRHTVLTEGDQWVWPKARTPMAEHLGWYDDQYWYLLPKAAFGAVWRFYRASGVVFPDSERGVRVKLREEGLSQSQDGRLTYQLRVGDERYQVLRVARPAVFDEEEGPGRSDVGQ